MTDKFQITIDIAGIRFKVPVSRENEEAYRNAAKLLNDQINYYDRISPESEKRHAIAMAAFRMALGYTMTSNMRAKEAVALSEVCKEIEDALSSDI